MLRLIISLFLITNSSLYAQEVLRIAILSDGAEKGDHRFESLIQSEINALLESRIDLNFTEIYVDENLELANQEIRKILDSDQFDVFIGVGLMTSQLLSSQSQFPIPTIASVRLDVEQSNSNQTSGIHNFTYLKSPFKIRGSIEVLESICKCQKLAILSSPNLQKMGVNIQNVFGGENTNASIELVELELNLTQTLSKISDDVGGVFILDPLIKYSREEIVSFFEQLNERELPSFSLLDEPTLKLGAYAAFATSQNLNQIPRRIALNVEKIVDGKNPKDFPIYMSSFSDQLIVNMETVNKVGKYPPFSLLDSALLIHINKPEGDRTISLKSAIAEGIQNNLAYQVEQQQSEISAKDISLARSNYLPQADFSSTGFFLDDNTINSSFGTLGKFNWTAGASFSQLIVSEPALANIAIQKLLFESQQRVQEQSELDVILEVAQRYFNFLQARTISELQNNNIRSINANLLVAQNKEKVGYSAATDVYRWQTELDLAKADLYQAQAQLKAVRYQLNQSLNRPIDEVFNIPETVQISQYLNEWDQLFWSLILDQQSLDELAEFLVEEAQSRLPELKQIDLAIRAQERLLKSNRRAFYIPSLAFGGSYDYPISTINPGEPLPVPGVEIENNPSWNAAISLSFPIVSGGARKVEQQKSSLGLNQLKTQEKDLRNLLELQIRANLELVNASYNNIRLTQSAADAAQKNILIVEDLYKTGQVNVTTLVDAQNALLGAQINATNAAFEFFLDFFALQRSVGHYIVLDTEEQNAAFLRRFLDFKSN